MNDATAGYYINITLVSKRERRKGYLSSLVASHIVRNIYQLNYIIHTIR